MHCTFADLGSKKVSCSSIEQHTINQVSNFLLQLYGVSTSLVANHVYNFIRVGCKIWKNNDRVLYVSCHYENMLFKFVYRSYTSSSSRSHIIVGSVRQAQFTSSQVICAYLLLSFYFLHHDIVEPHLTVTSLVRKPPDYSHPGPVPSCIPQCK